MSTTGSAQNSVRRWLLEQLTPESLAHTAERITGLSDAYTEDRPREALEVLARSLREEAGLTTSGLLTLRAHLIGTLMTRMRVQRDLRTLPEISSAPLPRPVFIVGVLRTGTTLLHHLLAQDPRARAPALWELMFPSPPPDPRAHETDTRVRWTDEYLAETFRRMPDLFALHPMESDAPDECQWLMRNSFQTGNYAFTYRVPTYGRWIGRADHDMVPVYRFYRAQLQLLTWRSRGEWIVLKDPFHLSHLDALLSVFPNARILQTHRDPAKVVPSAVRICAAVRSAYSDAVALPEIAQLWIEVLPAMLDRAQATRERAPDRFVDVYYDALMSDTMREVRRIYEALEVEWSLETERRMLRWLENHPSPKRAPVHHDLEAFGWTRERLLERFAAYCKRFAV